MEGNIRTMENCIRICMGFFIGFEIEIDATKIVLECSGLTKVV